MQVSWYDEAHKAVLIQFDEKWTWEELAAGIASVDTLMAETPHHTGVICDMRLMQFLPANILAYAQRLIVKGSSPPQFARICVIVGGSPFVRMMANVAHNLYAGRPDYPDFHCVTTIDEGYALIRAHILNLEYPSD